MSSPCSITPHIAPHDLGPLGSTMIFPGLPLGVIGVAIQGVYSYDIGEFG
jgi:hypothetical protein